MALETLQIIGTGAEQREPEKPLVLEVTVRVFEGGRYVVDSKNGIGGGGTIHETRRALMDAYNHYNDRFMAVLAEKAAKTLLAKAAENKDRNGLFRFLSKLH